MPALLGDDLIGHEGIRQLFEKGLTHPASAYLCMGEQHLGKHTIAERYIVRLLDQDIQTDQWRRHPDLILLEVPEGKTKISVEHVRQARERLYARPFVAQRMILYIPQADRLNDSGANALLKIVEEPPAGAVSIFVTQDPDSIPATLKSRCVCLQFFPVSRQDMLHFLVSRGLSKEQAEERALQSRGRPGLALEPSQGELHPGVLFAQEFLRAKTAGARLVAVEQMVKSCESESDPSQMWNEALHLAMRSASELFADQATSIVIFGVGCLQALHSIGTGISPRMPLEALAIQLSEREWTDCSAFFPSPLPRALPFIYTMS